MAVASYFRETACSFNLDMCFDLDVDLVLGLDFENYLSDNLLPFRH